CNVGSSDIPARWPKQRFSRVDGAYHSDVDHLTGLADAREFFASLPTLAAQDRLSLVLLDIDNLHSINNEQGEENVDRLLARLGTNPPSRALRQRRDRSARGW